ncbi:MAG: hypothetical protein HKN73_05305 [Gemmatimonadetes bacterium]|nr:hypothetical protein [Gemmatimonadota bacterium]
MRICLLTTQDLDADPFPEDDWPCDPRPFVPDAEWHVEVLEKNTAVQRVLALSTMGFDLFFNLCDGAFDESTPGLEVVIALERLEVPFVGAVSLSYEPSRIAMKRACHALGVATPAYVLAATEEDVERAAGTLRFPLIVKHPNSYASIDLTEASKVTTPEELTAQAWRMIDRHTATLIEEFIEGSEYTVLVAENHLDPAKPITYQPIQYDFPDGQSFKHHDVKWVDYEEMTSRPVEDPAIDQELRRISATVFAALGGASFGRVDIRGDETGGLYVLELNSNCGVYYEPEDAGGADLCLLADPAGHTGFTDQLIRAAFARHRRQQKPWEIRSARDGVGMVASREIARGDTVVRFEESSQRIVSLAHVESSWPAEERARFDREAWPLGEGVWAIWDEDPDRWQMPRHSCDPNVWFSGLDLVARVPIEEGREITVDYATFHDGRMPAFPCGCGAEGCRGIIEAGPEADELLAEYGGHVSPYKLQRQGTLAAT